MKSPHLTVGAVGERIAAEYLRALGYDIREQNVRIGHDEIDLIAFDPVDDVIVFVEVKTRSHLEGGFLPEKTAGWKKRRRLQRSARRWVARQDYDDGYRIDLVCIDAGRVREHFKELAW